jgi:hypothetical protein
VDCRTFPVHLHHAGCLKDIKVMNRPSILDVGAQSEVIMIAWPHASLAQRLFMP